MEASRAWRKKGFLEIPCFILACTFLLLLCGGLAGVQAGTGAAWVPATGSALFPARYGHTSVIFDHKMWVIGGTDGSGNNFFDVWHSVDGIDWASTAGSSPFPGRWGHSTVVFDDGSGEKMWVIGGAGDSGLLNDVWFSSDGDTWTQATGAAAFPVRYGHSSVVFDGKMWVIGGYGDDGAGNYGYLNNVWYSTDGITWTPYAGTSPFTPGRNFHSSVAFDDGSSGKIWVIGGTGDAGDTNDIWYSPDGDTWTQATGSSPFTPARYGHSSVIARDNMWVIAGWGNGAGLADVWNSTNGLEWTRATGTAAFPARYGHSSLVFEDRIWVIGGTDGAGTVFNDVWYSPLVAGPVVTGITPAAGVIPGPVNITNLNGSNFVSGATVRLNRTGFAGIVATDVTVVSHDNITCTLELTGAAAGRYNVVVTNPDGQQGMLVDGFTVTMNAPIITGITPSSGVSTGPVSITNLSGSNFASGAHVMLNRTGYAGIVATDVTVVSQNNITCTFDLAGAAPGRYNIVVTNPDLRQGMLVNGFNITAPGLVVTRRIANTTINGLTVRRTGSRQSVTIDAGILPSVLIPNTSVLQVQPPADRGFRNITLYAFDGHGFSRTGDTIIGNITGAYLETEEIFPDGFSLLAGPSPSLNYTIDLSSYPPDALLITEVWETTTRDDRTAFLKIAFGNHASYLGTAYTTKITKKNFPPVKKATFIMSVNSSWNPSFNDGQSRVFIERISDDRAQGEVLHTDFLSHDPASGLDYYIANSSRGLSTFGLSSLSGNNNPFQLITLTISTYVNPEPPQNPVNPATNVEGVSQTGGKGSANPAAVPVAAVAQTGVTASLYTNPDGVLTQAATLKSADGMVTISAGTGVIAKDTDGKALTSFTLTPIPEGNLPGSVPANTIAFAGRAYELKPDGAVFSPGISMSFVAPPDTRFGQIFSVKSFDPASGTWQDLPTRYDPKTGLVTAQVSHFCCIALFAMNANGQPSSGQIDALPQVTGKPAGPASFTAVGIDMGIFVWIVNLLTKNMIIDAIVVILFAGGILYVRTRLRGRHL
jgi:hypothetical protein